MTVHNILSSDILHLNTFSTFTHKMLEKLLFHVIITHDALDFATVQGPLGPDLAPWDLTVQGPPQNFQTCSIWTSLYRDSPPHPILGHI